MKKNPEKNPPCENNPRLLSRALDASSCSVVIADAGSKEQPLIYVNPAFSVITGYTKKEALGRNCRFLQGKDTKQEGLEVLRRALKKKESCEVVLRNYRKDGVLFWNELRLAPVIDAEGKLTHYIGIQTDITARVKAQEELEGYRRELEAKVSERTRQLEEKNLALREILGQIEAEKRQIKERVAVNVDRLILPMLKKIGSGGSEETRRAVSAVEKNLENMTSSFGSRLTRKLFALTPREIEICNLILAGLSTKDIAGFFHVSPDTVENQRNAIRKKLNISGKEVNLTAYLQSLAEQEN